MAQYKTPGVYIVEKNAFPNSVVEVATAVPAFIGYTEKAARDKTDLINIPTRISSLAEFDRYFGGPPKALFTIDEKDGGKLVPVPATLFLLYRSMRLFFDNGGGPCWIVSIGGYEGAKGTPIAKKAKDFDSAWPALAKEAEPTMIVVPDAVLLSAEDWKTIANTALQHCVDLGSRIAILDIFDGDKARTNDADDVISGDTGFRRSVNSASPSYAVAYYPWLNTSIVEAKDIDYTNLDAASRKTLADSITVSLKAQQEDGDDLPQPLIDLIGTLTVEDRPCKEIHETHQSLMTSSSDYKETMGEILKAINVIPPSGAMAGVYTRTDNNEPGFPIWLY